MDHGILFDHARTARIGLPEAVFCEGKPLPALLELLSRFGRGSGHPVLFTRLAPEVFAQVPEELRSRYDYHALSRTAFGEAMPARARGRVAVVSAGTADGFVTWEAARTLQYLGIAHKVFEDCGVAGLWRLAERLDEINSFDAVICACGKAAVLPTEENGLVKGRSEGRFYATGTCVKNQKVQDAMQAMRSGIKVGESAARNLA